MSFNTLRWRQFIRIWLLDLGILPKICPPEAKQIYTRQFIIVLGMQKKFEITHF